MDVEEENDKALFVLQDVTSDAFIAAEDLEQLLSKVRREEATQSGKPASFTKIAFSLYLQIPFASNLVLKLSRIFYSS